MRRTFSKFFIFINIILISHSWAVTEQRVQSFEEECLSEETEVTEECKERYEQLLEFLAEEDTGESSVGRCSNPEGVPAPEGLEALSEEVHIASAKLTCSEQDQKEVEGSCGDQLFCNVGRSTVRVLNNLPIPSVVAQKTSEFFSNRVSREAAGSCTDQNESDCLTEVFTSYVSNLIGTFNGLGALADAAKSAFWGLKDYLFKKSDDLHAAASSSVSSVSAFIKSPGAFIMEKVRGFKNSVDQWIKSEVFCQKWEGKPHAIPTEEQRAEGKTTTCEKPLEAYSCLNCNDGLNAFCAGAGLFLSEGMIAMATAGIASSVRIGARAGAAALRSAAASRKGAAAITDKVPLLARITEGSGGAARASSGVAARAAGTAVKVASASFTKVRNAAEAFADKLLNNRVARVITAPVRAVDDVAARMVERTTRAAALLKGNGRLSTAVRTAARQDFKDGFIRSGGKARVDLSRATGPRRVITGSRFARRGVSNRATSGNSERIQDRSGAGEPERDSRLSTNDERGDLRSSEDPRRRGEPGEDRRDLTAQRERERRESERQRQREKEEAEERERARIAALEAARASRNSALTATRAALVADMAAKGVSALNNGASQYAEKLLSDKAMDSALNGGDNSAVGANAVAAIESRVGESFDSAGEAQQFAQNMNDIYSDPDQRNEIIDGLVTNRGLTREQANRAYRSERDFYANATKALNRNSGAFGSQLAARRRVASSLPSSREESELTSEMIDVAKSIGRIRESLSNLREKADEIEKLEEASSTDIANVNTDELIASTPAGPVEARSAVRRVAAQRSGTPFSQALRAPSSIESSSPEEDRGETEGVFASSAPIDEEKEAVAEEEIAEKEDKEDEEKRRASMLRIERAEILSDLMKLLSEVDQLRLSRPSEGQMSLLKPYEKSLNQSLELDNVRSFSLQSGGKTYVAFKDLSSGQSIIVENSGRMIENLPRDLF